MKGRIATTDPSGRTVIRPTTLRTVRNEVSGRVHDPLILRKTSSIKEVPSRDLHGRPKATRKSGIRRELDPFTFEKSRERRSLDYGAPGWSVVGWPYESNTLYEIRYWYDHKNPLYREEPLVLWNNSHGTRIRKGRRFQDQSKGRGRKREQPLPLKVSGSDVTRLNLPSSHYTPRVDQISDR